MIIDNRLLNIIIRIKLQYQHSSVFIAYILLEFYNAYFAWYFGWDFVICNWNIGGFLNFYRHTEARNNNTN